MGGREESAERPPLLLRRAAARFFDSGVLLVSTFVLLMILRRTELTEQEAAALASLIAAWTWWFYETVLVGAWGATVGKRLTRIRVVGAGEAKLTPLRAAVRALPVVLLFDALLGLVALIVWASAAVLPEGRGLHDRLAGTRVALLRWRPDADGG